MGRLGFGALLLIDPVVAIPISIACLICLPDLVSIANQIL